MGILSKLAKGMRTAGPIAGMGAINAGIGAGVGGMMAGNGPGERERAMMQGALIGGLGGGAGAALRSTPLMFGSSVLGPMGAEALNPNGQVAALGRMDQKNSQAREMARSLLSQGVPIPQIGEAMSAQGLEDSYINDAITSAVQEMEQEQQQGVARQRAGLSVYGRNGQ